MKKKINHLIYKPNILFNQKIYLVFLIISLKLAFILFKNLFYKLYAINLPLVYINRDINTYKLFKIK